MHELTTETEAIKITQYDALKADIAIAKQAAEGAVFQYEDPKGNKLARSYVHGVRLLKGRIESARKEAKSYALEYGRKVDAAAKDMQAEVITLIEPHQAELDRIEQKEKDRIERHQSVIALLVAARETAGLSSSEIADMAENIQAQGTDHMEEYRAQAEEEKAAALETLADAYETQLKTEEEAAELARLRAAEEARLQAEHEERIRQEAREQAEREATQREAQIRADAEAKEQAAKEREERVAREAKEAEARRIEQDRQRDEQAKRAAAEAAQREAQLKEDIEARKRAEEARATAAEAAKREAYERKRHSLNQMHAALMALHCGLTKDQAKAIVIAIDAGEIPHISTPWS